MKKLILITIAVCISLNLWSQNNKTSAKSDSLFAKGVELYNLKKYEEAIPYFEKSDLLDKEVLDSTSNRRNYSAEWLASCYDKIINGEQEGKPYTAFNLPPVDRRKTVVSDSLSFVGLRYWNEGKFAESLACFKESNEIEKSILGEIHFSRLATLDNLANGSSILQNYEDAITYTKEALNIYEKLFGKENLGYAIKLSNLGTYYACDGNFLEAIRLSTEALNIHESFLDLNRDYAILLKNLVKYHLESGNYEEGAGIGTYAVDIVDRILGKDDQHYCLLLNDISLIYYNLKNYPEAIKYGKESLNIHESLWGKENPDYFTLLLNLVDFCGEIENYPEAIKYGKEKLIIQERMCGKDNPDYVTQLSFLASNYSQIKDYQEAIRLTEKAINICESKLGKQHPDYATLLNYLHVFYSELSDYQEAIRLATRALNIFEQEIGTENPEYINTLLFLSHYHSCCSDYVSAAKFGNELLIKHERLLGKENQDYLENLFIVASYYAQLNDDSELDRLITEGLTIKEKILKKDLPDDAMSLSALAAGYAELGNYSEAARLNKEALNIQEKNLGKNNPVYAYILNELANNYAKINNYDESLRLGLELLKLLEQINAKEQPAYATVIINLASDYDHLGNYEEAIKLGSEALIISERISGKEQAEYALILNNLATYYSKTGNFSQAIKLGTEALNIRERILGKYHSGYNKSLNNLAAFYEGIGDYSQAIKLGTEALNIQEKISGKDDPDYAKILLNQSAYYRGLGDYSQAIKLGTEALNIQEKILGKDHSDYGSSLNSLADYYAESGSFPEAIKLCKEALEIKERVLGKEHPETRATLYNLANYCLYSGDYSEALKHATEVLKIQEKTLGKNHLSYCDAYLLLTLCELSMGKTDKIDIFQNEIYPVLSKNIRTNFAGLTSNERYYFWKENKILFESSHIFPFLRPTPSSVSAAYDVTLLSKGILLSTDMELSNIIQASDDSGLKTLYMDLKNTRNRLNKLYEININERNLDTDSLERVVDYLERDLVERSREYGDFTQNMTISWKEVQSKLNQKDLAIEFVSFPLADHSQVYAAYVINPKMEAPQMVPLFGAKDLSKIEPGNYYNTIELSKLVWTNLDPYLENIENVYFAPDGELYRIAIESLPYYKGKGLMSDFHNFYRLSSTRELVVKKEKIDYKQAVLYGGMKFDTESSFLEKDMEKYPELKTRDFSNNNVADHLNLRNGVEELPGTATEVDNIGRHFKKTSIKPLLYKGLDATEASFKSLSGKKVKIIHIATHGFYLTEEEVRRANDFSFRLSGRDNSSRYVEDKALTRSGLLFSGANNSLQGFTIPEGVEDGILTAAEIAALDLKGLELVVLSACKTGLGEITDDGVFGLQRGFKRAGANSILMSLWKVDDEATQILMTKFYEEYLGGKSKFEALKNAQSYLRDYQPADNGNTDDRPYADPKYWAAFILLDGLN